ncbi:MAG: WbqC family protein [Marinibacterium sp.]
MLDGAGAGMRVAVMQPYFYPYMGYFRLIAAVDLFVLFDCVQFPRRGRVHRCEMPDGQGGKRWLTLPLARQPRDVRICDLTFAPEAEVTFAERLAGLAGWAGLRPGDLPDPVAAALDGAMVTPVDFVETNLRAVAAHLDIATPMVRSSTLNIAPDLRGGARVRAIARACGGTAYVNAPGGRALYPPDPFAEAGLDLHFLAPYEGPHIFMMPALAGVPRADLAGDAANWRLEAP